MEGVPKQFVHKRKPVKTSPSIQDDDEIIKASSSWLHVFWRGTTDEEEAVIEKERQVFREDAENVRRNIDTLQAAMQKADATNKAKYALLLTEAQIVLEMVEREL